ncbi:MAG: methyltransferase domain-containing protein [Candidatus Hermodarchaeota archaeon]|nr:methyltransferase domain-containing protein [Candidatus Hermodarchaeota archaeon]
MVEPTELPGLMSSGAKEIADRLAKIEGGRVLDVCTGKGKFIETLMKTLKAFDSFFGVDIDADDLAAAREKIPGDIAQFMEMDAERLEFADASFDTVAIAFSLHHLPDVHKVLAEMKRVLKPGGHFIVEEMYQDGEQSEAQHTGILEHHWTAKVDRLLGIHHNETLTQTQILLMLDALQFSNLEAMYASRNVQCLFCAERFECEDPTSEAIIAGFIKGVDKTLQQLTPEKRPPEIVAEAEQLKSLAQETVYADASLIFAIGRK